MLSFAAGTIPTSDALSNVNSISDSVIVENAVVNMNVSKIANREIQFYQMNPL